MGRMKFPKEKPEIAERLDGAVRLIKDFDGDDDVLKRVYRILRDCADTGSPRAHFLKACFLYMCEETNGESREEILSALDAAAKGKYPLADGIKILYLSLFSDEDAVYTAIRKAKYESPQALYYEGGYLSGYINAPRGVKLNREKACICYERAARLFLEYEEACRQQCRELQDVTATFRNPYYFSVWAGQSYQMLMYVYSDIKAKDNVQRYIAAYSGVQKYGNTLARYKTAAVRAFDCMDNVMGMHSLKTVNAVLKTAKETWAELSEEEKEDLQENYDELWEAYDEFYDFEMRRLKELGKIDVYTSSDYTKQDSLLSDFAGAVQQWAANRPPKTEYTVTVDNKEYKLNDLGEMVDEYGQSNGLRVDVTSKRVYDSNADAVGFFDSFGEFHKY